jgi:hypothetical protein
MVALLISRVHDRMRCYGAGFLFQAARVGLFASVRAFHRGVLNMCVLHESLYLVSNVRRYACHLARDRPLLHRRY